MCATNLTWANLLKVRETVTYQPSQSLPDKQTQFQQEATITACTDWTKLKNKLEETSVERFRENAKRGREGFEAVLEMSRRVFGEQKDHEKEMQSS